MEEDKGFITTPSTKKLLEAFDVHCDVAKNKPILIVGPSGAGKSWFLKKYKSIEKSKDRPEPLEIDCSMFVGEDANMARSALFGHAKGAFTGAEHDKPGLIKEAKKNGASLILDEVGELPQTVQAMLLVYMETGKFRPVGSMKEEAVKTKIIAATNREQQLREELRYRFFKFYIPGLHERREDILPIFASLFENSFKQLRFYEILSLLSYHWPGNVREMEQAGMMMEVSKRTENWQDMPAIAGALFINDGRATQFNIAHCRLFEERLERAGYNLSKMENILKKYKMELDSFYNKGKRPKEITGSLRGWQPFNLDGDVWEKDKKDNYQMDERYAKALITAYNMFSTYFGLLSINTETNVDLMTLEHWEYKEFTVFRAYGIMGKQLKQEAKAVYQDIENSLCNKEPPPDLTKYSYEELMTTYHRQLLAIAETKTAAAKLAGVPLSTFQNRLKTYSTK